ncbi:MAG: Isoleucyl-tRNA synthetase, partial [Candidatus Krumholzibacteriota bacterium]|nr:Isoleucyl-tRNA synthetase [Candidatus Krumholzibacteriota bacterium]
LVANAALAVGPHYDYARVSHKGETLILAEALLGVLQGPCEVLERFKGETLVGSRYEPLFDYFAGAENGFTVRGADFVSLEDGTGIVHIAPAFGEDDYQLHLSEGVPLLQPVTLQGTLSDEIVPWAGLWIKDADPKIIQRLKEEGKLYASATIRHAYPFCWRCSTALVYYARRSWYIRTTAFKNEMIAANQSINWIPKEVGENRFGNWLENNVDWALSRERYWGTPLPIWVCAEGGHRLAVGSIDELRKLGRDIPEDSKLDLHRPQVDGFVIDCPECGGEMRRVKEVIDAWFDSGSMPFAQYHYPVGDRKTFDEQYPADFISEGIDQSRGWFYSLLAISTFVTGVASYKTCVVAELVLDKKGQKMSKTRGNVVKPWDVLNSEGADALRWYLISSSPPWVPTRFDRKGVVDASQKLLGTVRNVYSFFAMYAGIDGYRPGLASGEPNLLDRWILSRFHSTVAEVRKQLDAYDMTRAARTLQVFVLDELSNWYIRRSRRRFWKGEMGPDKIAAYNTLHTVLEGTLRLLAPFVPFVAEEIHQAVASAMSGAPEGPSVHLEPFPVSDASRIDEELEALMDTALVVSSLGRTVRNDATIKIRQPLSEMVIHDYSGRCRKLVANDEIREIVLDELHVKELRVADDPLRYVTLKPSPAYAVLGKRFGKRVPEIAALAAKLSQQSLAEFLRDGRVSLAAGDGGAVLEREDMGVGVEGIAPYGGRHERGITVALNLALDDALRKEGIARELVNRIQNLRKKAGFEVSDRIRIRYAGGPAGDGVLAVQGELIRQETLATAIEKGNADWKDRTELEFEGELISLWIQRESN